MQPTIPVHRYFVSFFSLSTFKKREKIKCKKRLTQRYGFGLLQKKRRTVKVRIAFANLTHSYYTYDAVKHSDKQLSVHLKYKEYVYGKVYKFTLT